MIIRQGAFKNIDVKNIFIENDTIQFENKAFLRTSKHYRERTISEKWDYFDNICIIMSSSLYVSLKERMPYIFREVVFIDTRDCKMGRLEPCEKLGSHYSIKIVK